ncbi:nucleoside/nucleotide kinase family protein [Kitasatospora sp. NBC_01287]|uniref:nucleoside/nucleotide kinase family protein n=1 Tax=Kitasatospora sp. NBC_01287 TaxID=2903573 RepID=UPI0022540EB8|nr:nucleoside/nucleotide kinase family protein [Kitasatospora sp. NBC_01287]MCX4748958.1 nucleoside/nucleotide kinase family protein [Kitasatospora sp. NBC_01287]
MKSERQSDPTPAEQPADLVAQLLATLRSARPGGRMLLGLTGAPAAGKSSLARHLVAEVNRALGQGTAAYVPMDGFHLSNAQLDRLDLRRRKGAPATFDVRGYLSLLERLVADRFHDIYVPDFDRSLDEPVAARHLVSPGTRLVVTEGNYLAADAPGWAQVRSLLGELWYLEAEDRVRTDRLVRRHQSGGQDRRSAEDRVTTNDHPNGEYVKLSRARCTRILRVADLPQA